MHPCVLFLWHLDLAVGSLLGLALNSLLGLALCTVTDLALGLV